MSESFLNDHSNFSTKHASPRESDSDVIDVDNAVNQPLTGSIVDASDLETDFSKLRRVPDSLPASVWIITVIETCERFAYFGIMGPLQNYVQNARDDPLRPGGLGRRFDSFPLGKKHGADREA